jgi:hypothetical protein
MTLKSDLYNLLKDSPAELTTSYALYTVEQLVGELKDAGIMVQDVEIPEVQAVAETEVEAPDLILPDDGEPEPVTPVAEPLPSSPPLSIPVRGMDPNEMAGQRLNTQPEDVPIRIDEMGRAWFQEEVRKPSYPKPRGRRVLKYMERGTKVETVQNGEYVETFEVAGEGNPHPAEVKVTLPSYQVGIYKDPRFPFKIHCYSDREGFNFFEVADFYGGVELVPQECKRIYIENDLCYDIRSVVRAIQNEHRQLQLMGKVQ